MAMTGAHLTLVLQKGWTLHEKGGKRPEHQVFEAKFGTVACLTGVVDVLNKLVEPPQQQSKIHDACMHVMDLCSTSDILGDCVLGVKILNLQLLTIKSILLALTQRPLTPRYSLKDGMKGDRVKHSYLPILIQGLSYEPNRWSHSSD